MDDIVTICPICMETLKIPRCISCSHTFCQNCLRDHIETSCQGKDFPAGFRCPVCCTFVPGSISEDPSHWAKTFPKNATIDFMIQNDDKKVLKFCKPCLNDTKKEPAATLCRSCMEFLCEGCTSYHKKLTITKDHEVVPLDEINKSLYLETEEDYCNKHDLRYLDLFCFDHDTPCCSVCSVTEHKTCKMDTIEKAFEQIEKEDESQQMLSEIDHVENHLKRLKEIQNEKERKIEDKADEIKEKTTKIRQEINETLDRLEHKLLEDLAQNMKSTRKAIDGNKETFSDFLDLSNHCKEFLTNHSKRSCNPGYVGGFYKIKKQLKRLKRAKLFLKDADITATFFNVFLKKSGRFASLSFEETSLFYPDIKNIPKECAQSLETVRQISWNEANIHDILSLENDAKIFVCLDNNFVQVGDNTFEGSQAFIHLRYTIFRAVMLGKNMYAVTDKEKCYSFEMDQNYHPKSFTKFITTKRCFGISSFQDSLLIGSVDVILQMDTNRKQKKSIPAQGCVVDIVSLTSGNLIYISKKINSRPMEDTQTVRAIDDNGHELWKYEHPELKYPRCLTTDLADRIYIIGYSSNNIHVLSNEGYALKIFEQIPDPSRIIYMRENKDFLVVSRDNTIKLFKFTL
ncbi:uncharacterized protein LOC128164175 [Crassostrea angulata]|uniref:uncharacterized protein LOC128164175 n=1 Tax=Magallana angulata TaxID=2784310 RepID=UPI0022B1ADE2|nr:uncharacterized protein LOC128164175 [Crassostrea angulata]